MEYEFVVLPYEEFVLVKEQLQDFDDLKALRAAKAAECGAAAVSTSQARKALGIEQRAAHSRGRHPPRRA